MTYTPKPTDYTVKRFSNNYSVGGNWVRDSPSGVNTITTGSAEFVPENYGTGVEVYDTTGDKAQAQPISLKLHNDHLIHTSNITFNVRSGSPYTNAFEIGLTSDSIGSDRGAYLDLVDEDLKVAGTAYSLPINIEKYDWYEFTTVVNYIDGTVEFIMEGSKRFSKTIDNVPNETEGYVVNAKSNGGSGKIVLFYTDLFITGDTK